jgi:molecular chaperone DnaK
MPEIAVGIDLGTSNACVAVSRQRRVEVLRNAYGEPVSASVVAFREDGDVVVGNAARANIIHDPTHTVCSAKRLIGRYFFSEEVRKAQAICAYEIVEGQNHSVRVKVRDELFSLPEISAMVLKEMKSVAEAALGQPISKAVITVPAYFNDNQRQATRDAGRIAGLEVLRLLNEPTAAALAYGFGRGLSQKVAVYDLGGGTFDISVLQIGKDVFEVLSTCGDTFLGGDDFDDRLIDMLAEDFLAHEGINLRKDPFALEKLKVAAEAAKKGFSMDDEVEIRIPDVVEGPDGQPRSIVRRLAESEFSGLVQDLLQRTFKVCDEALAEAGLVASDLDGVILVGGPTRLHALRRAVADYFGQEPKVDVDPDEAVAMGAAIHASSLVGSDVDSVLLDVTPLSLKIGVAGGLAETVIERNTPVPIEQTRTFTTFQDYQESVRIQVFQGESRSVEENEQLGQFTFSGFRRAARGQVRIQVTFEIDTDGIVNVTALDPETGQQASTQITLSSGLSPEELDRILQERKTDRVRTAGADEATPPPVPEAPEPPPPAPEEPAAAQPTEVSVSTQRPAPPPELDPPTPVMPTPPVRSGPRPSMPAGDEVELEVLPDDSSPDLELDVLPQGGASRSSQPPVYDGPEPEGLVAEAASDELELMPEGADLGELTDQAPAPEAPLENEQRKSLFGDAGEDLGEPETGV